MEKTLGTLKKSLLTRAYQRTSSEIVGSRQPILFVEGNGTSLDITTYRGVYNDFTVIPVCNCESVIHSVESFRRNTILHSIGVQGVIDADSRSGEEIALLAKLHIHVLPVVEIENIFLIPTVFAALAASLHHVPLRDALAEVMPRISPS